MKFRNFFHIIYSFGLQSIHVPEETHKFQVKHNLGHYGF